MVSRYEVDTMVRFGQRCIRRSRMCVLCGAVLECLFSLCGCSGKGEPVDVDATITGFSDTLEVSRIIESGFPGVCRLRMSDTLYITDSITRNYRAFLVDLIPVNSEIFPPEQPEQIRILAYDLPVDMKAGSIGESRWVPTIPVRDGWWGAIIRDDDLGSIRFEGSFSLVVEMELSDKSSRCEDYLPLVVGVDYW